MIHAKYLHRFTSCCYYYYYYCDLLAIILLLIMSSNWTFNSVRCSQSTDWNHNNNKIVGSNSGGGNTNNNGGGGGGSVNKVVSNSKPTTSPQPIFDKSTPKNVTALMGKTAYLHCKVKNLGNKTVSWVRHRDVHLLTVGRYTYTSDQRFRTINDPLSSDSWTLMIKYPQLRDSGIYECQVSTTPHISQHVYLKVVEPSTEILGGPDVYIDRGSTINLTCVVSYSPEPPGYVLWNHNDVMISYDSPRGGINVVTEKGVTTTSYLLIQRATDNDNGRYQCNPANGKPTSIEVHVLNGEHPAAIQHGGQAHHRSSHLNCLIICVLLLLVAT